MSTLLSRLQHNCVLKKFKMVSFAVAMLLHGSVERMLGLGQPILTSQKPNASNVDIRKGIEIAISDMHLNNEETVIDPQFGWQHRPQVTMHAPRGDAISSWWKGNRPVWTHAVIAWFTVFEARGNLAQNSRVQVKNLRIFILSKSSRKWRLVDQRLHPYTTLWRYPFRSAGPACGTFLRAGGNAGISLTPRYPFFLHGWGKLQSINAADIGAVFAAMEFRLTVDNARKKDDRKTARYVVGVGADYYPDKTLRWSLDYAPGVGNGRMLLALPQWRTATLLVPNTRYGITFESLRHNPPPLSVSEGEDGEKIDRTCNTRKSSSYEK